jgi:uncharacterized protein YeaO (DUF488 family)
MTPEIRVKRVYESAEAADGHRVLVERLWPRGVRKDTLKLDLWARDLGASDALRRWYGHVPESWPEFQRRYRAELLQQPGNWQPLLALAREGPLTLLFSARDASRNNAVALRDFLLEQLRDAG